MLLLNDNRLDGIYSANDDLKIAGKSKEYYVLAILKHYFLGEDSSMVKKESPDLWDEKQSLGVEVTEAVFSGDAVIRSAHRRMQLSKDDESECKFAQRIIEYGGEFVHAGNVVNYPYHNEESMYDCIYNAIDKKTQLLSGYREKFKMMGLAVIIEHDTSSNEFYETLKEMIYAFSEGDFYDKVYIVLMSRVMYFDCKQRIEKCVFLDSDKMRCQNLARLTVEGKISMDDPVWKSI